MASRVKSIRLSEMIFHVIKRSQSLSSLIVRTPVPGGPSSPIIREMTKAVRASVTRADPFSIKTRLSSARSSRGVSRLASESTINFGLIQTLRWISSIRIVGDLYGSSQLSPEPGRTGRFGEAGESPGETIHRCGTLWVYSTMLRAFGE